MKPLVVLKRAVAKYIPQKPNRLRIAVGSLLATSAKTTRETILGIILEILRSNSRVETQIARLGRVAPWLHKDARVATLAQSIIMVQAATGYATTPAPDLLVQQGISLLLAQLDREPTKPPLRATTVAIDNITILLREEQLLRELQEEITQVLKQEQLAALAPFIRELLQDSEQLLQLTPIEHRQLATNIDSKLAELKGEEESLQNLIPFITNIDPTLKLVAAEYETLLAQSGTIAHLELPAIATWELKQRVVTLIRKQITTQRVTPEVNRNYGEQLHSVAAWVTQLAQLQTASSEVSVTLPECPLKRSIVEVWEQNKQLFIEAVSQPELSAPAPVIREEVVRLSQLQEWWQKLAELASTLEGSNSAIALALVPRVQLLRTKLRQLEITSPTCSQTTTQLAHELTSLTAEVELWHKYEAINLKIKELKDKIKEVPEEMGSTYMDAKLASLSTKLTQLDIKEATFTATLEQISGSLSSLDKLISKVEEVTKKQKELQLLEEQHSLPPPLVQLSREALTNSTSTLARATSFSDYFNLFNLKSKELTGILKVIAEPTSPLYALIAANYAVTLHQTKVRELIQFNPASWPLFLDGEKIARHAMIALGTGELTEEKQIELENISTLLQTVAALIDELWEFRELCVGVDNRELRRYLASVTLEDYKSALPGEEYNSQNELAGAPLLLKQLVNILAAGVGTAHQQEQVAQYVAQARAQVQRHKEFAVKLTECQLQLAKITQEIEGKSEAVLTTVINRIRTQSLRLLPTLRPDTPTWQTELAALQAMLKLSQQTITTTTQTAIVVPEALTTLRETIDSLQQVALLPESFLPLLSAYADRLLHLALTPLTPKEVTLLQLLSKNSVELYHAMHKLIVAGTQPPQEPWAVELSNSGCAAVTAVLTQFSATTPATWEKYLPQVTQLTEELLTTTKFISLKRQLTQLSSSLPQELAELTAKQGEYAASWLPALTTFVTTQLRNIPQKVEQVTALATVVTHLAAVAAFIKAVTQINSVRYELVAELQDLEPKTQEELFSIVVRNLGGVEQPFLYMAPEFFTPLVSQKFALAAMQEYTTKLVAATTKFQETITLVKALKQQHFTRTVEALGAAERELAQVTANFSKAQQQLFSEWLAPVQHESKELLAAVTSATASSTFTTLGERMHKVTGELTEVTRALSAMPTRLQQLVEELATFPTEITAQMRAIAAKEQVTAPLPPVTSWQVFIAAKNYLYENLRREKYDFASAEVIPDAGLATVKILLETWVVLQELYDISAQAPTLQNYIATLSRAKLYNLMELITKEYGYKVITKEVATQELNDTKALKEELQNLTEICTANTLLTEVTTTPVSELLLRHLLAPNNSNIATTKASAPLSTLLATIAKITRTIPTLTAPPESPTAALGTVMRKFTKLRAILADTKGLAGALNKAGEYLLTQLFSHKPAELEIIDSWLTRAIAYMETPNEQDKPDATELYYGVQLLANFSTENSLAIIGDSIRLQLRHSLKELHTQLASYMSVPALAPTTTWVQRAITHIEMELTHEKATALSAAQLTELQRQLVTAQNLLTMVTTWHNAIDTNFYTDPALAQYAGELSNQVQQQLITQLTGTEEKIGEDKTQSLPEKLHYFITTTKHLCLEVNKLQEVATLLFTTLPPLEAWGIWNAINNYQVNILFAATDSYEIAALLEKRVGELIDLAAALQKLQELYRQEEELLRDKHELTSIIDKVITTAKTALLASPSLTRELSSEINQHILEVKEAHQLLANLAQLAKVVTAKLHDPQFPFAQLQDKINLAQIVTSYLQEQFAIQEATTSTQQPPPNVLLSIINKDLQTIATRISTHQEELSLLATTIVELKTAYETIGIAIPGVTQLVERGQELLLWGLLGRKRFTKERNEDEDVIQLIAALQPKLSQVAALGKKLIAMIAQLATISPKFKYFIKKAIVANSMLSPNNVSVTEINSATTIANITSLLTQGDKIYKLANEIERLTDMVAELPASGEQPENLQAMAQDYLQQAERSLVNLPENLTAANLTAQLETINSLVAKVHLIVEDKTLVAAAEKLHRLATELQKFSPEESVAKLLLNGWRKKIVELQATPEMVEAMVLALQELTTTITLQKDSDTIKDKLTVQQTQIEQIKESLKSLAGDSSSSISPETAVAFLKDSLSIELPLLPKQSYDNLLATRIQTGEMLLANINEVTADELLAYAIGLDLWGQNDMEQFAKWHTEIFSVPPNDIPLTLLDQLRYEIEKRLSAQLKSWRSWQIEMTEQEVQRETIVHDIEDYQKILADFPKMQQECTTIYNNINSTLDELLQLNAQIIQYRKSWGYWVRSWLYYLFMGKNLDKALTQVEQSLKQAEKEKDTVEKCKEASATIPTPLSLESLHKKQEETKSTEQKMQRWISDRKQWAEKELKRWHISLTPKGK